ncbi:putative transporter HI_0519 [Convolutriloba macropyga]|uniref:putative transporter HI_0519 n=1 Tax=Convolutriloba macropyga TaxID=536237 RepID=UPI003F523527
MAQRNYSYKDSSEPDSARYRTAPSDSTNLDLESRKPTSLASDVDSEPKWIPIDEASPGLNGNSLDGNGFFHKTQSRLDTIDEVYEDTLDRCRQIWAKKNVRLAVKILVYLVMGGYVIAACILHYDDARPLLIIYILALLLFLHELIKPPYKTLTKSPSFRKSADKIKAKSVFKICARVLPILFYITITALIIFAVIYWNYEDPIRLKSAGGLVILILFSVLISNNKRRIKLRTLFWGLALQFGFGMFVLRTEVGLDLFDWLGAAARDFLDFSQEGISFVFKPVHLDEMPQILAITTLMVVPFFSAFISALYYLGLMQYLIRKMAWILQISMGTSAIESMSAAGNIFVGPVEAPLLVRPYLKIMTMSELHAVMTGGFATIAGSVFLAYVSFGISASHLISASVMSAPAALSFSKIVYPETEYGNISGASDEEEQKIEETEDEVIDDDNDSEYDNLVHAISSGAIDGITIVLNIIGNLIAFLSLIAAFNYILTYLGELIGINDLTLYKIFQYLFYPLAYILGADANDCLRVGELLGLKTIANDFVAYGRMSGMIVGDDPLSERSIVVTTYALCGFSNLGTIGIQIGGLSALAPNRRADLAKIGISSFITGSIACFSTACVAGLLYESD